MAHFSFRLCRGPFLAPPCAVRAAKISLSPTTDWPSSLLHSPLTVALYLAVDYSYSVLHALSNDFSTCLEHVFLLAFLLTPVLQEEAYVYRPFRNMWLSEPLTRLFMTFFEIRSLIHSRVTRLVCLCRGHLCFTTAKLYIECHVLLPLLKLKITQYDSLLLAFLVAEMAEIMIWTALWHIGYSPLWSR